MVTPAPAEVLRRWRSAVNAEPERLEEWLTTPESASVGSRAPGAIHSVGQLAGMRTVDVLQTPSTEWTESDWAHVRRTIGFVRRHRAQWPSGDLGLRRWTYSLRNWGHDPLWWGRVSNPSIEDGAQAVSVDGQEVGVLDLSVSDGDVAIERLELTPDWRGRGVGSVVLHEVSRLAARRVRVDLLGTQTTTGEFFQRRGFGVVDAGADHSHLVLPRR
ncbi:GNAT family N-acetyltransferase [Nocardioides gilvus]|uniref:GNAT family N-acetyltransferase n=1 Tax=Nocardioides gilvus TaxID=1735589 RepID=UPI000D749E78|nr:GNAT family N-acetyltransferase [Nocardioides gilvus]